MVTMSYAEHLAEGSPGPRTVTLVFSRKKHLLNLVFTVFPVMLVTHGYQLIKALRKQ